MWISVKTVFWLKPFYMTTKYGEDITFFVETICLALHVPYTFFIFLPMLFLEPYTMWEVILFEKWNTKFCRWRHQNQITVQKKISSVYMHYCVWFHSCLKFVLWFRKIWIFIYIFFQIFIPFVLLIVLNIRTYRRIVEFEQTLNSTVRVKFQSTKSVRRNLSRDGVVVSKNDPNTQSIELVDLVEEDENYDAQPNNEHNFISRLKSKRFSRRFSRRGKSYSLYISRDGLGQNLSWGKIFKNLSNFRKLFHIDFAIF